MRLVPLESSDIQVGVALPWPVYDRNGLLLLKRGTVITNELQLQRMLERGRRAETTVRRDVDEAERERLRISAGKRVSPQFASVGSLAGRLAEVHSRIHHSDSHGVAADVCTMAESLREVLWRDADATLAKLQMDSGKNNFVERHLHAAALCEVMAKAVGMPEDQRLPMLCAALTFDVGFIDMHDALAHHVGPLTVQQREALERHPVHSVHLLAACGVSDARWLDAVLHHHERADGSGYPDHLHDTQLRLGARVLAIADSYSAMIRPRCYRNALQSRAALKEIFIQRTQAIDAELAATFIKELGIFPPGSYVRLANRELGVVVRRGEVAANPVVKTLIGSDGVPLQRPILRYTHASEHAIAELVSAERMTPVADRIDALWAPEAAAA